MSDTSAAAPHRVTRRAAAMLSFAAFITSVVIAEVILRLLGLAPTKSLATVSGVQFDTLPGIMAPSPEFTDTRHPSLPYRVRVNALGFRGPEFPLSKPRGEYRILHVGDSFVFGDFVDEADALPQQVERALRTACGSVRVVNVGLSGSTITDQRELIRRARRLNPDLVLLSFTENDVADLGAPPLWSLLERHRAQKERFPMGLLYPLLRRTALWNLAMQVRGRLRANSVKVATQSVVTQRPDEHTAADSARRRRYADALRALAAELREAELPLVLTDFPSHLTLYGPWSEEQLEWFESLAAELRLPVIPSLGPLRADGRGAEELFLLPRDGHPSAAGYAVAAREIVEALRARDDLAARCANAPIS